MRNRGGTGRQRSKTEIGTRNKDARRKTTAKQVSGGRGREHREQVSSDGYMVEQRTKGDTQEWRYDASKEWSGKNKEKLEATETEEEPTTVGVPERER